MRRYAIAIRTLGRAGEKYRRLLDSIRASACPPEKVVVVLPEGYEPPQERLGYEEFVFCPKSMIGQRLAALDHIDSPYTLFLDDDIAFDPYFVEKLLKPLEAGLYDCATGPLFSFFPASTVGKLAGTLTASVSVSLFHRDMYVKILRSGGWSYHTFKTDIERYYPTESFAWTCFMIRTETMRALTMEEEIPWVERFGYAMGDDRVMAYKLIRRGGRACIVANALYEHQDARTSTASSEMVNTKPSFCMGFFHTVFWHRYIRDLEPSPLGRLYDRLCFSYWRGAMWCYHLLKAVKPSHRPLRKAFLEGIREGLRYVKTEEYRTLPPVMGAGDAS